MDPTKLTVAGLGLRLQHMPHESHVWHSGENWAGITDPKVRKKLQNRLNKRISRQRKRDARTRVDRLANSHESEADQRLEHQLSRKLNDKVRPSPSTIKIISHYDVAAALHNCTTENVVELRAFLERFAAQALTSYASCDPRSDHRLRLLQLNAINAFTRNADQLGFRFDWLICSSISPFCLSHAHKPLQACSSSPFSSTASSPSSCYSPLLEPESGFSKLPPSLAPTTLQRRYRHHPWVDLFPLPRLRDNLLEALEHFLSPAEEERLFDDIFESQGTPGPTGAEWAGLVVWGEPWDPQSWEVSLPFLRRWGWLLVGCPEILAATNHWRSKRGEKRVTFPIVSEED